MESYADDTSRASSSSRPANPTATGMRSLGLALMVAATSLAVGASTSYWLVPIYLLAMGWLLGGARAAPEVSTSSPSEAETAQAAFPNEPNPPPSAEPVTADAESEAPPKPKGRPRGKRSRAGAKAKVVEPGPPPNLATWIQVAPGKFVRVEVPVPLLEERSGEAASISDPLAPAEARAVEPIAEVSETEAVAVEESGDASEDAPVEPTSTSDDPSGSDRPTIADEAGTNPVAILPTVRFDSNPDGLDDSDAAPEDAGPAFADLPLSSRDGSAAPPPTITIAERCGATARRLDPAILRSTRPRKDTRPRPRRPSGRVGARPRVVLHRA